MPEVAEHVRHVGGGVRGGVRSLCRRAACRSSGVLDPVADVALRLRAVDRVAPPGAACVDKQHGAVVHQWCEQVEEVVGAVGRGVAGAALVGDERADRASGVGGRVVLEPDRWSCRASDRCGRAGRPARRTTPAAPGCTSRAPRARRWAVCGERLRPGRRQGDERQGERGHPAG